MDKNLSDVLINIFDSFPDKHVVSPDSYVFLHKTFFSPRMYIFEFELNNEIDLIITNKWK